MGISPSRVFISSISSGSLVVKIEIRSSNDASDTSDLTAIEGKLRNEISNPLSQLYSGDILSLANPSQTTLTSVDAEAAQSEENPAPQNAQQVQASGSSESEHNAQDESAQTSTLPEEDGMEMHQPSIPATPVAGGGEEEEKEEEEEEEEKGSSAVATPQSGNGVEDVPSEATLPKEPSADTTLNADGPATGNAQTPVDATPVSNSNNDGDSSAAASRESFSGSSTSSAKAAPDSAQSSEDDSNTGQTATNLREENTEGAAKNNPNAIKNLALLGGSSIFIVGGLLVALRKRQRRSGNNNSNTFGLTVDQNSHNEISPVFGVAEAEVSVPTSENDGIDDDEVVVVSAAGGGCAVTVIDLTEDDKALRNVAPFYHATMNEPGSLNIAVGQQGNIWDGADPSIQSRGAEDYKKLLQFYPSDPSLYQDMALTTKVADESLRYIDKAVSLDPLNFMTQMQSVVLHILHGDSSFVDRRTDELLASLKRLHADGIISREEVHYTLQFISIVGYTMNVRDSQERASGFLREALKYSVTKKEKIDVLFREAYVWSTKNDPKAMDALREILKLDPGNKYAQQNLNMMSTTPLDL
eukprot:g2180.t1